MDYQGLIDKLKEKGLLIGTGPDIGNSYHCSSCSCRDCRFAIEECHCSSNELWEILHEHLFNRQS